MGFEQWEHIDAKFDTDYTDLKKNESTNILAIQVREHLNNKYQNHIKIFTNGSVLDSLDSGAGFVIPELKVQKSFYLGKGFSIFISELYAILMALSYICNIQLAIYNFVICVDSKSVLCALKKLELYNERGYILRSKVFNKLYHVRGYWD